MKTPTQKLKDEIEKLKDEMWKVELKRQKSEKKRFPIKKFEREKEYKKRIERVYIKLIEWKSELKGRTEMKEEVLKLVDEMNEDLDKEYFKAGNPEGRKALQLVIFELKQKIKGK